MIGFSRVESNAQLETNCICTELNGDCVQKSFFSAVWCSLKKSNIVLTLLVRFLICISRYANFFQNYLVDNIVG